MNWKCEGCGSTFAEYVNGCPRCWEDNLTPEENRRKYPNRKVIAVPSGGRPTLPEEGQEILVKALYHGPAPNIGYHAVFVEGVDINVHEQDIPAPPVPAASVTPAVEREAMELVKRMANRRAVSADGTPSLDDATKDYIEARRLVAAARGAGGKGEGQ